MPQYQRRKTKSRQKHIRRGQVYGGAAYQIYKDVKKLKQLINTEIKEVAAQLNANYDFNGINISLVQIPQGDTGSTRDGLSLKMQDLEFKLTAYANAGVTGQLRVIVYLDDANTINTNALLLEHVGSVYSPLSLKKYENRFKTKVYFDKVYTLNAHGVSPTVTEIFDHKKLAIHKHVTYSGPLGTDISDGQLRLAVISDQTTAGAVGLRYNSRLTYTDN